MSAKKKTKAEADLKAMTADRDHFRELAESAYRARDHWMEKAIALGASRDPSVLRAPDATPTTNTSDQALLALLLEREAARFG